MPTGKGSSVQLLMGEESTWGTVPGTPAMYKLPISQLGGNWFRQNLIDNPELRGNRNPPAPVAGNRMVAGSFTSTLHLDAIGWIMKHAVGTPATTGTGPYTHVGKVGFSGATAGDLPTGMYFEHGFTDITVYHVYSGCRVSTLGLSMADEGVAQFEVNVIGRDLDDDNVATLDASPTTYTSDALSHFSGALQEGSTLETIAYVKSVDFTLNNGLDDSVYVVGGAGLKYELPENTASLTGNITALFQSNALLTKAIAGTETSLSLAWTSGTSSLTLAIPEVRLEAASPTVSGDRGVLITLPFRAYYANHSDATILKYTLVNSVATY